MCFTLLYNQCSIWDNDSSKNMQCVLVCWHPWWVQKLLVNLTNLEYIINIIGHFKTISNHINYHYWEGMSSDLLAPIHKTSLIFSTRELENLCMPRGHPWMTDDVIPTSPAIFIIPFDCLCLIFIIARHVNVLQLFCSVTITNVLNENRQKYVVVRGLMPNTNKPEVNFTHLMWVTSICATVSHVFSVAAAPFWSTTTAML